jgi:hypothetical protein
MQSKKSSLSLLMNTGETSLVGEEIRIINGSFEELKAEIVGFDIVKFRCVALILEGPMKGHLAIYDCSDDYILTRLEDEGE